MDPTEPSRVVLESRNDRDISGAELAGLAEQIRRDLETAGRSDVSVAAVAHEALGAGNHWNDVLNVILPSQEFAKDLVWEAILDRVTDFMRGRFSRQFEESRPRVIVVQVSETGEVLGAWEAKDAEREFEKYRPGGEDMAPPA